MELPAFTGVPSPLTIPITQVEVQLAISKLNSGRTCGHDDLTADLMKSTADLIAPSIATIFNVSSTKCGQFGSEGHRLAFFCDYGSIQHSSCLYLRTYNMGTWGLTKTVSMHITVVTCGRSSVSAGNTVSQVPLSALLDGACSDTFSDCH